jgi:TP901 family phage tail tape measure protein
MAANQTANFVVKAKDQATGPLGKIGTSMGNLKRTSITAFKGIAVGAAAITAAFAAFAIDAVKKAAAFETAMLNVNSIAKLTPAAFADLQKSVLELSKTLPQSGETLAQGLYDISSSGFAGAEGLKVLDAAAKAASAGLAQTSESAAGITAVLNAYSFSADEAQRVSDILFKTVDRGVITFPELASEIGKVTALSAPLGVSLEDVAAGLAVLTKNGIDAENATTQLNAIMQAVLSPTGQATELAKQLGIDFTATGLRTKGLNGFMADLIKKTGGSNEAIAELLGDARAIRGAFVLAKNGGAQFNEELELMKNSAGATDTALSYQKQGLAYQLGILGNNFDAMSIELGQKLIPSLNKLVEFIMQNVVPAFGAFLDTVGPVLVDIIDNYVAPLMESVKDLFEVFGDSESDVNLLVVALTPLKIFLEALKITIDAIVFGLRTLFSAQGNLGAAGTTSAGYSPYLANAVTSGTFVPPMGGGATTNNIFIGTGKVDTVVTDSINRTGTFKRGR